MGALAELAAAMPASHKHRPEILRALSLGLKARNSEMVARGVMNKESALDALLLVVSVFAEDPAFRRETNSEQALRALMLLVSAETRSGKQPLAPGSWGKISRACPGGGGVIRRGANGVRVFVVSGAI